MLPFNRFFLFFFACLFCFLTKTKALKNKNFYEKKKYRLQKKIQQIQKIINNNYQKKKSSIAYLNTLHIQVKMLEKLLYTIAKEKEYIERKIQDQQKKINQLKEKKKSIAQEYAHMLNMSQKKIQHLNQVFFILSASSFYQMLQRAQYLKQYAHMRSLQMKSLTTVNRQLVVEKQALLIKHQAKAKLQTKKEVEKLKISQIQKEQKYLIQHLQLKEKKLKQQLQKNRQSIQHLNKLIQKIIRQTIVKKKDKKKINIQLTPEGKILSKNFAKNKGKLPWPVKQGFIACKFGKNKHPVLKDIITENLGINIQTTKNAQVYAIFYGVVKTVAFVPGMQKVIIIQHGKYHSVYAHLQDTFVDYGQQVDEKTIIGTVSTNEHGNTILQFQLWKNIQKYNPEVWLSKELKG